MRKKMVVGNWKMNTSLASARQLLSTLDLPSSTEVDLVVAPPLIWLSTLHSAYSDRPINFAAQDVSEHQKGAYTGEISASMLHEAGCRYVLVGHSERRQYHAETDAQVVVKCQMVQAAGLVPIICVGETLTQRDQGETESVIGAQIGEVIRGLGISALFNAVVAYEPVWAIGTGRTASTDEAQRAHAFLRGIVARGDATIAKSLRILYGGSVKPDNAQGLFKQPDIDGGLVGGASLVAHDFNAIVRAACVGM
jgi:triosephosphate isomerase